MPDDLKRQGLSEIARVLKPKVVLDTNTGIPIVTIRDFLAAEFPDQLAQES